MRKVVSVTITTNKQANDMLTQVRELQPTVGAFDTEDDGLHIINAKPFLFQFGYLHPTENILYTYVVDVQKQPILARQVIIAWRVEAAKLKIYLGHNVKFDLHMLLNIGIEYTTENLSDTMFYIRYGHDNLTPENGGPPLGLKPYASQYITATAKGHEKRVTQERSEIAKVLNMKLKQRLSSCGRPPAEYGAASYTTGVLTQIFKDPIADWTALPTAETRAAYDDWLHLDVPAEIRHKIVGLVDTDMIPYTWCDRKVVTEYAHYDIVLTLEVYEQLAPIVTIRKNDCGIELENSLILPLLDMERVGFRADKPYILSCQIKMRDYIIKQRKELHALCGESFSISQHAKVLSILQNTFMLDIATTRDDDMSRFKAELLRTDPDNRAVRVITLIQQLRTLEKWYSTYILRFVRDLQFNDRLYTTINQVGTVSFRVTSDFQQFPKDWIRTEPDADHELGEEIFHPRKMILVTGGEYPETVYLDFSQVELRVQAMYTILVGNPDLNLCRAYMPHECINTQGVLFDHNNLEHLKDWRGEWYLKENPTERWTATDVHAATTKLAFGVTEDDPAFHRLRYDGKRVNFAKNYGAQLGRIMQMFPNYTREQCIVIDDAYYKAFPGVKAYHEYCKYRASMFSNTSSLFGPRYYGVNGHKLINLLIQGSSALYLKIKIRQIYDYSKAHNIKSKWQMQIHDELSWERHVSDDPAIFFEYKRIMEDWDDGLIPLVAEMEVTRTTWKDKKGVDNLEQLQDYFSTGPVG